jgi:hypothetical protein
MAIFVVDASVVLAWCFEDEASGLTEVCASSHRSFANG